MPMSSSAIDARAHPTSDALIQLKDATLSRTYVSMGTRRTTTPHEFYRYPARFSPSFANAAIAAFTDPGDLVLDPFVGGGTTLVESMWMGRRSVGSDLNPLATFVSSVKTTPLTESELDLISAWIGALPELLQGSEPTKVNGWEASGYFKDLDGPCTRPLQATIARAIHAAGLIRFDRPHAFARCVILRTAQWALDMRSEVPTVEEFDSELLNHGVAMLRVAQDMAASEELIQPRVLTQKLPGLSDAYDDPDLPSLILTSPPYPGVYVLYHRWKLRGRREIPAPYWIADRLDGHGMARYTMSARSEPTQNSYFMQLQEAFADLASLCSPNTWLVQVVGFNEGTAQLDRYLEAMNTAGFTEQKFPSVATADDGRLWREVPNRRWWTEATSMKRTAQHTSREVILFHQPAV